MIPNSKGQRTTPSCVAFTNKGRLVGESAVKQSDDNPENTIFESKRIIGRNFGDSIVQSDTKRWPFKVFIFLMLCVFFWMLRQSQIWYSN